MNNFLVKNLGSEDDPKFVAFTPLANNEESNIDSSNVVFIFADKDDKFQFKSLKGVELTPTLQEFKRSLNKEVKMRYAPTQYSGAIEFGIPREDGSILVKDSKLAFLSKAAEQVILENDKKVTPVLDKLEVRNGFYADRDNLLVNNTIVTATVVDGEFKPLEEAEPMPKLHIQKLAIREGGEWE